MVRILTRGRRRVDTSNEFHDLGAVSGRHASVIVLKYMFPKDDGTFGVRHEHTYMVDGRPVVLEGAEYIGDAQIRFDFIGLCNKVRDSVTRDCDPKLMPSWANCEQPAAS